MIQKYFVNKDHSGNPKHNHEVHAEGCRWMPSVTNRIDLGYHEGCGTAIIAARTYYNNVDGCHTCCSDCHHQ